MTKKEFNLQFGKKRFTEEAKRFYFILIGSVLIHSSIIIFLANIEYHDIQLSIEDRYISYIINSDYIPQIETNDNFPILPAEADEIQKTESSTAPSISEMVNKIQTGPSTTEIQLSRPLGANERPDQNIIVSEQPFIQTESGMYVPSAATMGNVNPGLYSIEREANIRMETPDYFTETKKIWGYRDQDEIMAVIYDKSGLIESCYERQARRTWIKKGYVKVQFNISPRGFVLPGSIRIIDSTIRNKSVEQCIKKNIRRWREFEKLDNNHGIAKVVHKFIFN